jgi:flagellar hook-associated protein 2
MSTSSIGGTNFSALIEGLMRLEARPRDQITARKNVIAQQRTQMAALRTRTNTLLSAARSLASGAVWSGQAATSSDSTVASAVASSGALAGTLSFTVDRLATAGQMRTAGTLPSTSSLVTTDSRLALAAGGTPLGIRSVRASGVSTLGTRAVSVTTATQAATATADAAFAGPVNISAGVNDALNITVNGVSSTIVVAAGSYTTQSELQAAIQTAVDASGPGVVVLFDSTGKLQFRTAREGSAATLDVTSTNASLGFNAPVSAAGADGAITVDGSSYTVSDTNAPVVAGDLTFAFAGGLRTGAMTTKVVSAGSGTMTDVVNAINGASAGMTASAVQTAPGQWQMMLSSTSAGSAGSLNLDSAAFAASGGLATVSAAADAQVTIGSGPGAVSVTSTTNTFNGLLAGVNVTVSKVSSSPVSITVGRDSAGLADKLADLVTKYNDVVSFAKAQTKFDATTKTSGVLSPIEAVQALPNQLAGALNTQVAASVLLGGGAAGITTTKDGTVTFDRAKFLAAFAANPDDVMKLFAPSASSLTADISLPSGMPSTVVAGAYNVNITTAATQATSAVEPVGLNRTITVTAGVKSVSFTTTAAMTAADVASGLSQTLAQAGIAVESFVSGAGIQLKSQQWGSAGNFTVDFGMGAVAVNGADVAGTIDGQAAVGSGRALTLSAGATSGVSGITLSVGGGVSGSHTVDVSGGVTQALFAVSERAAHATTGSLSITDTSMQTSITSLDERIAALNVRLDRKRSALNRKYGAAQAMLATMQAMQQRLAASMPI